jgi:hypothetical protein
MGIKQAWQGIKYGRAILFPLGMFTQWADGVFQPYKVKSPIDSGVRRSEERSSRQDPLYRRPYEFERFVIEVLIRARVWNSADEARMKERRKAAPGVTVIH